MIKSRGIASEAWKDIEQHDDVKSMLSESKVGKVAQFTWCTMNSHFLESCATLELNSDYPFFIWITLPTNVNSHKPVLHPQK